MNDQILYNRINKGVLDEKLHSFRNNLKKNQVYINKYGGLKNIVHLFKEKNVIIAGAGPGLDSDLDVLKKYQNRDDIVIISTDMALRSLIKNEIFPAFVISCETTPVDYFSGINSERMRLLAFSCMSNTNLKKWKGAITFYNWMIDGDIYDTLWKEAGIDLGFVATGSIVTSQAVSLVLGCEIRSLMLLGNDMGYSTQYYVKETPVYQKKLYNNTKFYPIETAEYNTIRLNRGYKVQRGEKYYYTNNQFLAAKKWLEELFSKVNITISDTSDFGCSSNIVQKQSLKKYLNELYGRKRGKRK